MKRILVVADPIGGDQKVIDRAVALARSLKAELQIAGFVFEHLVNLPTDDDEIAIAQVQEKLLTKHRKQLTKKFREAKSGGKSVPCSIDVHWEKRVAEAVCERCAKEPVDLVMKGAHRSETFTYTSTDWQLLRGCRSTVMLVAEKRWKRSDNVIAAVDLGTKTPGKKALNRKVVAQAAAMAQTMNTRLIVAYAVPISRVLRDLDIIDEKKARRAGAKRLEAFCESLAKDGIAVDGTHLAIGAPERALVSAAAKNRAGLIVLGCVGRKRLAGKVIGNTAEQILRLARADVMAVKPD